MLKNKKAIKHWLNEHELYHHTIYDDLSVDVHSNVYLMNQNLTHLPIQFGVIMGNFFIDSNPLESLNGLPSYIEGTLLLNIDSTLKFHQTKLKRVGDVCGLTGEINDTDLAYLTTLSIGTIKHICSKETLKLSFTEEHYVTNIFHASKTYTLHMPFESFKEKAIIYLEKKQLEHSISENNQENLANHKKLKI